MSLKARERKRENETLCESLRGSALHMHTQICRCRPVHLVSTEKANHTSRISTVDTCIQTGQSSCCPSPKLLRLLTNTHNPSHKLTLFFTCGGGLPKMCDRPRTKVLIGVQALGAWRQFAGLAAQFERTNQRRCAV